MGVENFDYAIYQGRWFDDSETHSTYIRWTPWKTIEEWEYAEMLKHIDNGAKYQIRILSQIYIKGYGIDPDKIDLYCPRAQINPGL
jgi:hypothetical protein